MTLDSMSTSTMTHRRLLGVHELTLWGGTPVRSAPLGRHDFAEYVIAHLGAGIDLAGMAGAVLAG